MISQIFISIIVFNFFGNVYTEHNGQNTKSKEINLQEINEKLDHLTIKLHCYLAGPNPALRTRYSG